MACISSETGSLVFAVINLIMVCLSTASSLGMLIYWGMYSFEVLRSHNVSHPYANFDNAVVLAVILGWFTFSLLTLVFSSFLLNGSLKKKPEHMKAYFVYGVVKMTLTLLGFALVLLGAPTQAEFNFPLITTVIIGLVVYGFILHMIRHAYTKIQNANEQYSHKPLNEKC